MSESPKWIDDLIVATHLWIADVVAPYTTLWEDLSMILVALRSGAEHELDYYTRQQGNWWFEPDGSYTYSGPIYGSSEGWFTFDPPGAGHTTVPVLPAIESSYL